MFCFHLLLFFLFPLMWNHMVRTFVKKLLCVQIEAILLIFEDGN